jgi:hypothetical protein
MEPGFCSITQRRWLSKGTVSRGSRTIETLNRILPLLHHEAIAEGLAALRFWGQTGERSAAWMAGADPVHFEAMLRDLRLHAFNADDVAVSELGTLFDDLQTSLGGDGQAGDFVFVSLGSRGYLKGNEALATAPVSADIAAGGVADTFMPTGAGSESYHCLLSELQMSLHDHPVNHERAATGDQAINALWIWGGGFAPDKDIRPILPLFSDDPLCKGYWESCSGVTADWTGSFEPCFDLAIGGFVVVLPRVVEAERQSVLDVRLQELRHLLNSGRISELSLLWSNGLVVQLKRYDFLKFWRGISPLICEQARDD